MGFGGAEKKTTLLVVAVTTSAGAVVYSMMSKAWQLRVRLRLSSFLGRTTLSGVKVAVSTLRDAKLKEKADDEGFVLCDVTFGKTITKVVESQGDCAKGILSPTFADSHTHVIKTETVPRNRNPTGSMTDALLAEIDDQPRWKSDGDISRRMRFALECARYHGTKYLRTHLDGSVSEDPAVRDQVWLAFESLRDEYEYHGMTVQGVANMYLPLYRDVSKATAHADDAKRRKNVVLGAYVGNVASEDPQETIKSMEALFAQAERTGLDVDLHIDETNDPKCCGLLAMAAALRKARARQYQGTVVLGHCTSLALQADPAKVIADLSTLGNVVVVANPLTNLSLQDRRGSTEPFSVAIPDRPRTPQWRGITLLQELRAANIPIASASDNVRDHWFPYGDYDLLAVLASTVAIAHLDTAPTEGSWFDIVTDVPARAMGFSAVIAEGHPADLVLFPNARRASELFARPHHDRIVLRSGNVQSSTLPDFNVLDDLVQPKTIRTNLHQVNSVTRGGFEASMNQ